jgi:hypothetical protein
MYNEQLEKLIDMALMDGELTEKEKQILFKKAEAMGVDLDEFEMVLDARFYDKKQNASKELVPEAAAPKSDKLGDIKKCPACGSIVGAFKAICSDCGHEFSNIESASSVQKLYTELVRVEEEERNRPKESPSGIKSLTALIQGDNDPMAEINLLKRIYQRKSSIVSSFPVPNTKADILEFMSMAVAEGGKKTGGFFSSSRMNGENEYIKSWRSKAEQVVIKARFSLKDDKKLLEEINAYASQLNIK